VADDALEDTGVAFRTFDSSGAEEEKRGKDEAHSKLKGHQS